MTSEEEYRSIITRRNWKESKEVDLYIWNVEAPYVEEKKCYYIPQTISEEFYSNNLTVRLNGRSASLIWYPDVAFENMRVAIKEAHVFRALIYTDEYCAEINVLFTGMPVMCIYGEMGEEHIKGLAVFDPVFCKTKKMNVEKNKAWYEIRGNMSRSFDKKSYQISFLAGDGVAKKMYLFWG